MAFMSFIKLGKAVHFSFTISILNGKILHSIVFDPVLNHFLKAVRIVMDGKY